MKLKIHENVMGNSYVPKEIQALCKKGVAVTPAEMVVFKDRSEKAVGATILFEHNSAQHRLCLTHFRGAPSLEELMLALPHTVRSASQPISKSARSRFVEKPRPEA